MLDSAGVKLLENIVRFLRQDPGISCKIHPGGGGGGSSIQPHPHYATITQFSASGLWSCEVRVALPGSGYC